MFYENAFFKIHVCCHIINIKRWYKDGVGINYWFTICGNYCWLDILVYSHYIRCEEHTESCFKIFRIVIFVWSLQLWWRPLLLHVLFRNRGRSEQRVMWHLLTRQHVLIRQLFTRLKQRHRRYHDHHPRDHHSLVAPACARESGTLFWQLTSAESPAHISIMYLGKKQFTVASDNHITCHSRGGFTFHPVVNVYLK